MLLEVTFEKSLQVHERRTTIKQLYSSPMCLYGIS